MWLFYITIAFGLVYLVLYPGLGKLPGVLGWTSAGAYASERKELDDRLQPLYAKYLAMDVKARRRRSAGARDGRAPVPEQLRAMPRLRRRRQQGFPNLRDNDWLYGGEPQAIKESITNGRNGIMPALGAGAGRRWASRTSRTTCAAVGSAPRSNCARQLGKPLFVQICAACHGADGKGNQPLGAPNLTDQIWLYGSSEATIIETISKGRGTMSAVTRMPAHKELLDEGKIQLLAAYVWGLSNVKGAATQ